MHNADAVTTRQARLLTLVGVALSALAVAAAALALVWVRAFPFAVASVGVGLWLALAAGAGLLVVALLQAHVWWRAAWSLVRASWWAHVASYVLLLAALVGFLLAAAWFDVGGLGFWLCLVGLLAAGLAQALGATQYLRRQGPPGTLRAHLRRAVDRAQARAAARDAELDAAETRGRQDSEQLSAPAQTAAHPPAGQRGLKR